MKTFKTYLAALAMFALVLYGCKKKEDLVSKVVNVTYPGIALTGDSIVIIPVGGSYSDEGATLTDDVTGASSHITAVSSDVDATTEGVYTMTYTAKNANGFTTTRYRTVVVHNPVAGLTDLSGVWERTNGIDVTYTQIQPGLYYLDNFAGSTAVYPAILFQTSDSTISIPTQYSLGLKIDAIDETLDISNTPWTITYTVIATGFGTSTRTFHKL